MSHSGRGRAATLLCAPVALSWALAACSNDINDLFAEPAQDSGTTPSEPAQGSSKPNEPNEPAELPALPAQPDEENVPACEACARESCATARDNCLEDDACTELLRCKGECHDPACLARCEAEHGYSAWYDDLWVCTFGSCGTECRSGQSWACVGEYDWPRAESQRFEVRLDFLPWPALPDTSPSFVVGARARYCPDGNDRSCGLGSMSATVDARSSVALEVVAGFGRTPKLQLAMSRSL